MRFPFAPRVRLYPLIPVLVVLTDAALQPVSAQDGEMLGKITSIQNRVDTRRPPPADWAASMLGEPLHARYRVRTGPESRAAILYTDETLQVLDENTEQELLPPTPERPGLLKLLLGKLYFSSRRPREFRRLETPAVTAAIKGTEFVVEVAEDTTTTITMLEGVVEASNALGTLTVGPGEQAYVEPGRAPVRRIVVRPRDAVIWALYYPPVLGGSDAARLEALGAEGETLVRAARLLSTGQVDDAKPLIDASLSRRPDDPIALALAAVTEVAADRKAEAMRLAERATAADPRSPAAALALSYAAQAAFDIPRAREQAERAAAADPDNALALARAAELAMAEGDIEAATDAARRAVAAAPGQARALAVMGFVELSRFRSAEAKAVFERAVATDSSFPLARLGLGLARFRLGDVDAGVEEIRIAASLNPDESLIRSYLGKAYYEQRRPVDAAAELAAAKRLDPADPTPYLYDAIRKQNDNRPVEALRDLRESIARNDNRAVYRSRLLLDQDRAVRGSDLARIYNDLGFDQLGLVTARRSADENQASYSSHLFLAGNYRNIPNFAPAFLSEILQARIYQPTSVNAARPDVVNETVSFNEYTALFDRPRTRIFGGYGFGEIRGYVDSETDAKGFRSPRSDRPVRTGDVSVTANGDRYAAALGAQGIDSEGFYAVDEIDRVDQEVFNFRGFLQVSPTYRDSLQINFLGGRQDTGDLPLETDPLKQNPVRIDTALRNLGLGYHRAFRPGSHLAISFIHNRTAQTVEVFSDVLPRLTETITLQGEQVELQQVLRTGRVTWLFGGGAFEGEAKRTTRQKNLCRGLTAGCDLFANAGDDSFANGYLYATVRPVDEVALTFGGAVEDVTSPTGLFPPRNSILRPVEMAFDETRFSPKLGITWRPAATTTLRAAGYERLAPTLGRLQTLEPTQVAGFNQFFRDPGGTHSRTWGVGLDQELGRSAFGGLSFFRRSLEIPEPACATDQDGDGLKRFPTCLQERQSHDYDATAYLNILLGRRLAGSVDYSFRRRKFDFTRVLPLGGLPVTVNGHRTVRVRPRLSLFLPNGLFSTVSATHYDQGIELSDPGELPRHEIRQLRSHNFTLIDLQIGYKLPRRYGSIVLEARNVSDREWRFFEREVEDTIIPARTVTLRVNFTY